MKKIGVGLPGALPAVILTVSALAGNEALFLDRISSRRRLRGTWKLRGQRGFERMK